jgi:hypothetical protein
VPDWLPYTGAFVIGCVLATFGAFGAFVFAMSTTLTASFFAIVVVLPMMVGLLGFGVAYGLFSRNALRGKHWLIAAATVFVVALFCFWLVVADILEELPATALMMVILYVGGRFGLPRKNIV